MQQLRDDMHFGPGASGNGPPGQQQQPQPQPQQQMTMGAGGNSDFSLDDLNFDPSSIIGDTENADDLNVSS